MLVGEGADAAGWVGEGLTDVGLGANDGGGGAALFTALVAGAALAEEPVDGIQYGLRSAWRVWPFCGRKTMKKGALKLTNLNLPAWGGSSR